VAPIEKGYATLGLLDKFISPAAVDIEEHSEKVALTLAEGGLFGAYCASQPTVAVNGRPLDSAKIKYKNGLLMLDLEAWKGMPVSVELGW